MCQNYFKFNQSYISYSINTFLNSINTSYIFILKYWISIYSHFYNWHTPIILYKNQIYINGCLPCTTLRYSCVYRVHDWIGISINFVAEYENVREDVKINLINVLFLYIFMFSHIVLNSEFDRTIYRQLSKLY